MGVHFTCCVRVISQTSTHKADIAILNLEMPAFLFTLERGLALMWYYHEFIPNFSIIARSLETLKIGCDAALRKNPPKSQFAKKLKN